jgi:uncharacterized membrane protein YkvA (DUF1232 family)
MEANQVNSNTPVILPEETPPKRKPSTPLAWIILILAIIYVVSPVDAIPDVIPIIGWIDDAGATLAGLIAALRMLTARRQR